MQPGDTGDGAGVTRALLETLLPHTGAMCLLAAVERWDAHSIVCHATSHLEHDNPLRCEGRLEAIAAVEYASQAIALHGMLRAGARSSPRVGYLGKLSAIELTCDTLDASGEPLVVRVTLCAENRDGCIHEFDVSAGGQRVAHGRILIAFAQT